VRRRLGQTVTHGAILVLATLIGACAEKTAPPRDLSGADPAAGLALIKAEGCAACHQIPGVAWPRGAVGGPLKGFANRGLIAGRLPNQPDTLVQWLRDAPALAPDTAMPATDLDPAQARDVAAYLYTLDED
jgi:sulfur-oxidizing protein SoxX